MVTIDIGDVQSRVGNFIDDICRFSTQHYPSLAGKISSAHRHRIDVFERSLINVSRLVPVFKVLPRIEHVIARDTATMTQNMLGKRPSQNSELQKISRLRLFNNLRPDFLTTRAG